MIFNKKIDKSLWMMMVADKQNSDKIVEFITCIPEGLKKQILDKVNIFYEYRNTGVRNFSFLCGEYDRDGVFLYSFEIDPYFEELDMGYMECSNGVYRDVFKMSLYLGDDFEDIRNFRKNYIGRIEYNIKQENIDGIIKFVTSLENEYHLIKTPLGNMVIFSKDDNRVVKNHFRMIDDMPEELYLEDIKDNVSENVLVRRKKK